MRTVRLALIFVTLARIPDAHAQVLSLPDSALSHWTVVGAEEIVAWAVFDPETVAHQLPATLRFITLGELADGRVRWAEAHLSEHPARAGWGISFIEIARMDTFTVDGRSPDWPESGAVALWFARVVPAGGAAGIQVGQPYLALEFWLPDSLYVAEIGRKGYPVRYGEVELRRNDEGAWSGAIAGVGLRIDATCDPVGPVAGGSGSSGAQTIFPPTSAATSHVVHVAFAGHHVQECAEISTWTIAGSHPLARAELIGPTEYQFGYHLVGGVYSSCCN